MSCKRSILIALLLLLQLPGFSDPVSRALKALKKGKHDQVEAILAKSLSKNSINPGARYAFSLLFFDSAYHNYHLDSAHWFIEQAIVDASMPDSLGGIALEKSDLKIDQLIDHKARVDSTAFVRTAEQNTVESFQQFIDHYANAAEIDRAVERRNQLAFEFAESENSYTAYKQFLDSYPDAEQADEATKRYNLLVFQSKTSGGKRQDYQKFLEEHPNTPYRNLVEWQLFQLLTLAHEPENYQNFKQDYPDSKFVSSADDILYHLDKQSFLLNNDVSDSLRNISRLESTYLIPIFEDGRYGFIDEQGNYQIPPSFDSIPENYLCQLLSSDVLQAYVNQNLVLLARNQKVLWDKPYQDFEDLGSGMLKLRYDDKYGILHKSGLNVLDIEYDQIKLLGNSLLAISKDGKWGISSMTGRVIVPIDLQSIEDKGAFILLKNEQWAVSNKAAIISAYQLDQSFSFIYDEWELLSQTNIMVFSDDKEGILNHQLDHVIPLSTHVIHELDSADWYVKTAHGTLRFYGENLKDIPADRYKSFLSNNFYICLLRDLRWEIWDRSTLNRLGESSYDSVSRIGSHLMRLIQDGVSTILFSNGATLTLGKSDRVKLIRDAGQTMGFLQVNTNGGKRQVYDLQGNPIYHTWYYDVEPLTAELFIIERNGLKGIVDLSGKVLIKPRYQTIVADSAAHISLLHNGRFGYFHPKQNALIKPQYESRITYFSETTLITSSKGKKGLIDYNNKVLVPFEYDQIRYWSDSSIVALKDKNWKVLNYYTKITELEDIKSFEWISQDHGHKAIIKTSRGYGLVDQSQKILLNPGFNDIINLGTSSRPVLFTEKYIPEADYFVVIYYNQDMEVIRKQVFNSGNYDQVYCY